MKALLNTIETATLAITKSLEDIKLYHEEAEKWNTQYINNLPDMAFAIVETGYKEGENKNARHLPHHNKSVKSAVENSSVDLPHYRNALARVNQVKSVLGKESDGELRKKAAAHLSKHHAVLKESKASFSEVASKKIGRASCRERVY
jgi:hypothetical protein